MDMRQRILLVDDEPELRRMVAGLLTGAGYEVAEAADCAQARAAMAAQQPDAVLLDVMLPDGDGFSLLPELRRPDAGLPRGGIRRQQPEVGVKLPAGVGVLVVQVN